MNQKIQLTPSGRIRKSPYYEATLRCGVQAFTVYNHMLMPTSYAGPEADYWNLVNNVTMWDVACERQVEISGSDAYRFVEYITPRDLSSLQVGQGKYAFIDRKSTRLNSSHKPISYAVFCLKKKKL